MNTLGFVCSNVRLTLPPLSSSTNALTNAREQAVTGEQFHYTPLFDGILRPWDEIGLAGSVPRDNERQGLAKFHHLSRFAREFFKYKVLTTPRLDHL